MPLHAKKFIVPLVILFYYTAVQFAIKYLPCRLINAGTRGNVSDTIMIFQPRYGRLTIPRASIPLYFILSRLNKHDFSLDSSGYSHSPNAPKESKRFASYRHPSALGLYPCRMLKSLRWSWRVNNIMQRLRNGIEIFAIVQEVEVRVPRELAARSRGRLMRLHRWDN